MLMGALVAAFTTRPRISPVGGVLCAARAEEAASATSVARMRGSNRLDTGGNMRRAPALHRVQTLRREALAPVLRWRLITRYARLAVDWSRPGVAASPIPIAPRHPRRP